MVYILKLGGSVITYKDIPLTVNVKIIEEISKCIKEVNKPLIIVHGGGSFGHYYSVKYDIHSKPDKYNIHGVSMVRTSMVELNNYITSIMVRYGLNPYTIQPMTFIDSNRMALEERVRELEDLANGGLLPITHGDVLPSKGGNYYILSGDEIMSILATILRPEKVIFALNVDGVYNNMKDKILIEEISSKNSPEVEDIKYDVTGGMKRKLREAFKIASNGIEVMFVNGLKPERIVKALNNQPVIATRVRV